MVWQLIHSFLWSYVILKISSSMELQYVPYLKIIVDWTDKGYLFFLTILAMEYSKVAKVTYRWIFMIHIGTQITFYFSSRFLLGGEHGRLKYPAPEGYSPVSECLLPFQVSHLLLKSSSFIY